MGWLAFLPNAPYLVTDFIHFHSTSKTKWLDIVLLSTYGLQEFCFSILVLKTKGDLLQFDPKKWQALATFGIIGSSAYGIYLGRVLRFNSWDVITNPLELMSYFRSIFKSILFVSYSLHYTAVHGIFVH